MNPIVFGMQPENKLLASLCQKMQWNVGEFDLHQFPDNETYIKIKTDVKKKNIILFSSLDNPNEKILPLVFMAKTARDLGARKIGLLAPYLSYMRQDMRFNPGEGITSKYFAELVSNYFDWIVTVDPHLHRYISLQEIYKIPSEITHASNSIFDWVVQNVTNPLIVGPDSESELWIKKCALEYQIRYVILQKARKGDHAVEITLPVIEPYQNCNPILLDDIISTGQTMVESAKQLYKHSLKSPICIGIHALFSDNDLKKMYSEGIELVITCNTIPHLTNKIDLSDALCATLRSSSFLNY